MYQAVILDIDGTLVDSNDAHARAWVDVLAAHGRRVAFERVRPLIGIGSDKLLPTLTDIDPDSPEGSAIADERSRVFSHDYLPHLRPTPGAQALLEALRDDRKKLYVATSAKDAELRDLLRIAGALRLVEHSLSSDAVARSKPDPDIVQAAVAATGCRAQDVIMLGDTPYDVEAATRAGVGIIALRCGGWDDRSLDGAVALYDTPQDLLDHYDVSPFKQPLPLFGIPR